MNSWALAVLGGGDHLLLAGVRLAKEDVLAHGAVKEEYILQHNADLLAQRFPGEVRGYPARPA